MKLLLNFSRNPTTPYQLVNFEMDEEERERDAMRVLIMKNKAVFQYLFKKYSSFGSLNKRKGSIDSV
jgi:hypothetical protein